jgi:hypothetical protein
MIAGGTVHNCDRRRTHGCRSAAEAEVIHHRGQQQARAEQPLGNEPGCAKQRAQWTDREGCAENETANLRGMTGGNCDGDRAGEGFSDQHALIGQCLAG